MRSVKDRGLEEIKSLKNRVLRSYGSGRIKRDDFTALMGMLEALEVKVVHLDEKDEEEGGE